MLVPMNGRDRLDALAYAKGGLPVGGAIAARGTPGHHQVAILQESPHRGAAIGGLSHCQLLDVGRRLLSHDRCERSVILVIELVRGDQVDSLTADIKVRAERVVDTPREP